MLAGFFILVFFYFIIASFDRWMFARGVPLGVAAEVTAEVAARRQSVMDMQYQPNWP